MMPGNLSEIAIRDFRRILQDSRDYGPRASRELQSRLLHRFEMIGQGRGLGHRRTDADYDATVRFVRVRPYPFVVIYDADSRIVLRIIHGARDFRALEL